MEAIWEPHGSLDLELPLGDVELASCPKLLRVLESEGVSGCMRVAASTTFVRATTTFVQLLPSDSGKDQKSGLWAEGALCSYGKDQKSK